MTKFFPILVAMCACVPMQAQAVAAASPSLVEICGEAPQSHIAITINPETRVSVARGSGTPPEVRPDGLVELQVQVVNNGFLTASLEARLVGFVPEGVEVDFAAQPLTGACEEQRVLRLHLTKRGLTDVTVSFRARRDVADLGGRDRVHFLLHYP